MEHDKRRIIVEARQRIAARDGATQSFADLCAGEFRQFQVTLHRVFAAIDPGAARIKKARTLARVAHSKNFPGAAGAGNNCTPQQALEIEREIGLELLCLLQPRAKTDRGTDAGEIAPGKNVTMVNVGVAAQYWRPFGINDPG